MNERLYKLKSMVFSLERNPDADSQIKLLEDLISCAEAYRADLVKKTLHQSGGSKGPVKEQLQMKKITEEVFLYRPVLVKNYYEGDYLERFSAIRTSDLKASGVLDIHNKFWEAHEVVSGNIFATVPLELLTHVQGKKLMDYHWEKAQVDVYEIEKTMETKMSKIEIINGIGRLFNHYLLVREKYGNILMVLHYKLQ